MSNLPKPSFVTEEEILAGGHALAQAEDTTSGNLERAVELGTLICDGPYAHVRYLKKDGALLYHVFRGPEVPSSFWGKGEFGLVALAMAESYWPMDKPSVEYHSDTCRQEVYGDSPREASRFPDHFYGTYLIAVPGIDRKLHLSDERIVSMVDGLEDELKRSIGSWSNGG